MELNKIIADILKCALATPDTDGITHYILDPKDIWNIDTFCMDWDKSKVNNKFILDIWEEEKSISLSYINQNKYLFNMAAFVVDTVYTYQNEDETDFVIVFQSEGYENFIIFELEPTASITIAPFHPLNDDPDNVLVRYKKTRKQLL